MSLKELAIKRARKINEQTAAEHAEREAEHLTRLTEKTKELFTDAFPDCVPFVEADGVTVKYDGLTFQQRIGSGYSGDYRYDRQYLAVVLCDKCNESKEVQSLAALGQVLIAFETAQHVCTIQPEYDDDGEVIPTPEQKERMRQSAIRGDKYGLFTEAVTRTAVAAMAMQGMLNGLNGASGAGNYSYQNIAEEAVAYSDALFEALHAPEKEGGSEVQLSKINGAADASPAAGSV